MPLRTRFIPYLSNESPSRNNQQENLLVQSGESTEGKSRRPVLTPIPVVLFAYARPQHLARVLECLRTDSVSLIYAYADGAKRADDVERVESVRTLLRAVDWCEVRLTERVQNMGLGASVLAGVSEVAAKYEAFIVWEDDLICVPGTYAWMCAALRRYREDKSVMSVSGWTHPRVTPADVGDRPYFDGRAECWVWGAYRRSWLGMEQSALEKMSACSVRRINPGRYGADLPLMARREQRSNIWAVRWLYHHIQHGGLCLRPPWSMVEHIGLDASATNAALAKEWSNGVLRPAPPIPSEWPEVREHAASRSLWRGATGGRVRRLIHRATNLLRRL